MTNSRPVYMDAAVRLTLASLAFTFPFVPLALGLSRPAGPAYLAATLGLSMLCITLPWICWSRFSILSMPSAARQEACCD